MKAAILVLSDPKSGSDEALGRVFNALAAAYDFKQSGDDVTVLFHGAGTRLREQIALTVAGSNGCDYCASAHRFLAKAAGVDSDEVTRNLRGEANNARTAAALKFAQTLVIDHGQVTDQELEAVRSAGFSDEEIVEIIGNVAVNLFTNYFNHVADTEIDFPKVNTGFIASAA